MKKAWVVIAQYLTVMLLSLAGIAWVIELWRADLRVPFRPADGYLHAFVAKTAADYGWCFKNPSVSAPFKLDLRDFPISMHLHVLAVKLISMSVSPACLPTPGTLCLTRHDDRSRH